MIAPEERVTMTVPEGSAELLVGSPEERVTITVPEIPAELPVDKPALRRSDQLVAA